LIFRSNFLQQFSAAIFRSNFPQQFSAAIFRLNFPPEFFARILDIRHNYHETQEFYAFADTLSGR
jgi:hypothetical protein